MPAATHRPRQGYTSVSKNETVECAGVSVSPGDIIVADEDGVVVVPKAHAKKVLKSHRWD
ncbi:MAG: hypothetical protein R2748_27910 [Bryobacterales bacterium]